MSKPKEYDEMMKIPRQQNGCNCIKIDELKEIIKKRKKFHKSFGLPISTKPQLITLQRRVLQYDMMAEELNEYLNSQKDLNETADALIDMFEILLGMFTEHGMIDIIPELYDEVNSSNMSKLSKDGKPIYREDGKVLKSSNYFKPNFNNILKSASKDE